jgi:hypothetical protein
MRHVDICLSSLMRHVDICLSSLMRHVDICLSSLMRHVDVYLSIFHYAHEDSILSLVARFVCVLV